MLDFIVLNFQPFLQPYLPLFHAHYLAMRINSFTCFPPFGYKPLVAVSKRAEVESTGAAVCKASRERTWLSRSAMKQDLFYHSNVNFIRHSFELLVLTYQTEIYYTCPSHPPWWPKLLTQKKWQAWWWPAHKNHVDPQFFTLKFTDTLLDLSDWAFFVSAGKGVSRNSVPMWLTFP